MDKMDSRKKTIILIVCICVIVGFTELAMFVHNAKSIATEKTKPTTTAVSKN